jgi:hypothetical protein
VNTGTETCPFCASPLEATHALRPNTTADVRGWKRAAIFSFGAALALGACSSTAGGGGDASTQQDTPQPMDAPATDRGVVIDTPSVDRGTVMPDVPEDFGGVAPPYGIAPRDAGPPDDDGTFKADYGAPPPPRDAGVDR